jgi:hypothetical protein
MANAAKTLVIGGIFEDVPDEIGSEQSTQISALDNDQLGSLEPLEHQGDRDSGDDHPSKEMPFSESTELEFGFVGLAESDLPAELPSKLEEHQFGGVLDVDQFGFGSAGLSMGGQQDLVSLGPDESTAATGERGFEPKPLPRDEPEQGHSGDPLTGSGQALEMGSYDSSRSASDSSGGVEQGDSSELIAPMMPPDVVPPSAPRGNRFAFLFNASQNGMKWVLSGFAGIALFVFLSPFLLEEQELRSLASSIGAEGAFEALGLIPDAAAVDPFVDMNSPNPLPAPPLPEANKAYFYGVIEALRLGDVEKAAQLMRVRPPQALSSQYDLDMTAAVSARYFLLVGKEEQALRAVTVRCGADGSGVQLVANCLPLARAYVGLGRYNEARITLLNLEAATDALEFKDQLEFVRTAIVSGQALSPRGVAAHLLSFMKPTAMDVEWERQQATWILQEFGRLGADRWGDLAKIIFQSDRSSYESAMKDAIVDSSRFRNALGLTRFLDFLALRYGHRVLGFEHGLRLLPLDDTRFALALQAVSSNIAAESPDLAMMLQPLRGKRPFGDVERLIAVNLAIQERSWNKAFQILNGQISEIPKSRFSFEWKLAGAAFAIGSHNVTMAKELAKAFTLYAKKEPKVLRSFDYWYTLARLHQSSGQAAARSIDQASRLAASEREQGLVASLRLFASSSNISAQEIEAIVQRFPGHDSVLEAAILASGRRNRDPSRFMAMQNSLTNTRLVEGREKNLLLDWTVEELLRLL